MITEEILDKVAVFISDYAISPDTIFLSEKYANQLIDELHTTLGVEFEINETTEFNGMQFIITTKDMVEVGVI